MNPRPLVMGVLNVTPDSFSDGGRYLSAAEAIGHGRRLFAEGADIVDVGGESTRPGAAPVSEHEEIARVVQVVAALSPHGRVSIDTRHESTARAAVAAGATLLNDVSASLEKVAAELGVGWVAMHMQGTPATMQQRPEYDDVVGDVAAFLDAAARRATVAGVSEVWIDPGFGFGKTVEHNLELLARLDEIVALGWPVLSGTSRKATLGVLTAAADGETDAVPVDDRYEASVATAVWAAELGASMVRAHDVRGTVQALQRWQHADRRRARISTRGTDPRLKRD